MSITRRQFLLGTTAGLILPSFYEKAFSYIENHGEPLLKGPKKPEFIMYACSEYSEQGYQLFLGHPEIGPPATMTIREFCRTFGKGDPEKWWRENWLDPDDLKPIDMNAEVNPFYVEDWWFAHESPLSRAYQFLQLIDLGPELENSKAVGGLDFYIGGAPGMGFQAVDALDEVSLSLLQQRLNLLGTGIEVRTY